MSIDKKTTHIQRNKQTPTNALLLFLFLSLHSSLFFLLLSTVALCYLPAPTLQFRLTMVERGMWNMERVSGRLIALLILVMPAIEINVEHDNRTGRQPC